MMGLLPKSTHSWVVVHKWLFLTLKSPPSPTHIPKKKYHSHRQDGPTPMPAPIPAFAPVESPEGASDDSVVFGIELEDIDVSLAEVTDADAVHVADDMIVVVADALVEVDSSLKTVPTTTY